MHDEPCSTQPLPTGDQRARPLQDVGRRCGSSTSIDFDVASGEVFGLLGPNGAGKSTTVGMLTTTVHPSAGHAALHGVDVATAPRAARAISAVVFQDPVVDKALSGRRNLATHARLWGVPSDLAAARITEQCSDFGISDCIDRPVSTYSGGQRRRLEIARALLSDPQVLFLDEPTVGLDPRIRFELLDLIAGLRARSGATVLLTTHYLDEAERLCDRIGIMHAGRIVALDTPANLLSDLGDEVLEVRVDSDAAGALALLRAAHIAGADAFTVGTHHHRAGARPSRERSGRGDRPARPHDECDEHPSADPRRRLPAPHRRPPRGVSLTTEGEQCPLTTIHPPTRRRPEHRRPEHQARRTRGALTTLFRRRFSLSARTPREILVPLLTPVLFALVIAPALASIGPNVPGLDYMSFAAIGTVGLLVPLNCVFAGWA